ncbi:MAG: Na+/H+ antiporter subunit D [Planctomycetaceae bacterium]|nr:Na+/H+ antiporter subunit D [Planctomycetaceae bacterium]
MPLILPILIPFLTAALALLGWRSLRLQRWLGVVGAFALLAAGIGLLISVQNEGIRTAQIGNWPAPYGITLVADHFAALLVLLVGIVGSAIAVYSLADIDEPQQSFAYYPLLHVLLMGVTAAFLAGDIFNLYVWFEVLLIASFVLLALGGERPQIEGAIKYVTLNLISSFLFLTAVGILYGAVGTLNMADVARKLQTLDNPDIVTTLAVMFLVAFGIKAAIFPLYFWLPASYHTPPAAVSAVFAALLTKVGIYSLIRMFTLVFDHAEAPPTFPLILVLAGLTMLTGVLGAIVQDDFRRVLSFNAICGVGYMMLGLGMHTPLALTGSIFYMTHSAVVTAVLFLIAGNAHLVRGTFRLDRLGGLAREAPWLAVAFAIAGLSLAGIPPLSGFVAKLILVRAGLEAGEHLAVAIAIAAGLLTLYSIARVWDAAFWKEPPAHEVPIERIGGEHEPGPLLPREKFLLGAPVATLVVLVVIIGLAAGPIFSLADAAANELMNPAGYIEAVLGGAS